MNLLTVNDIRNKKSGYFPYADHYTGNICADIYKDGKKIIQFQTNDIGEYLYFLRRVAIEQNLL
jgi:hypothetical protein